MWPAVDQRPRQTSEGRSPAAAKCITGLGVRKEVCTGGGGGGRAPFADPSPPTSGLRRQEPKTRHGRVWGSMVGINQLNVSAMDNFSP